MNIKNLKVVTVTGSMTNTNTFTAPINLVFVPQYMKVKLVSWNLSGARPVADMNTSVVNNQLFTIKSSLVNYECLTTFTPDKDSIIYNTANTIIAIRYSYTEHLDTTFKLYNQIINGIYSFELSIPETIFDPATYTMNVAIQLEFIEYA